MTSNYTGPICAECGLALVARCRRVQPVVIGQSMVAICERCQWRREAEQAQAALRTKPEWGDLP